MIIFKQELFLNFHKRNYYPVMKCDILANKKRVVDGKKSK